MEVQHWDDIPKKDTVFAVSSLPDESSFRGMWGIQAWLANGRQLWVLLGNPAEVIAAPNPVMAQTILNNLQSYSKMMETAAEIDIWGKGDSADLPNPQSFPVISWGEVPESIRLYERRMRGDIWGIVAQMPDGEHLVILDQLAEDAGYHTFSATQEDAQRTVAWLQIIQVPPDPKVEKQLQTGTQTPPFIPESVPAENLGVDPKELAVMLEEIECVELGWLVHLDRGKRESCTCDTCRNRYVRWLDRIADYFQEMYGGVPTEIAYAIRLTLKSWEAKEEVGRKRSVNWKAL